MRRGAAMNNLPRSVSTHLCYCYINISFRLSKIFSILLLFNFTSVAAPPSWLLIAIRRNIEQLSDSFRYGYIYNIRQSLSVGAVSCQQWLAICYSRQIPSVGVVGRQQCPAICNSRHLPSVSVVCRQQWLTSSNMQQSPNLFSWCCELPEMTIIPFLP